MKDSYSRKGFTLIELLIVIVVIGILSAMMVLSSTEVVNSAKASNIVAGLNTFKKALTHWYIDNYDKVYRTDDGEYKLAGLGKNINNLGDLMKINSQLVTKYISNASSHNFSTNSNYSSEASGSSYRFEDSGRANKRKSWFVGYTLSEAEISSGVAQKLAGRAQSAGLLSSQGTDGTKQSGSNQATKVDITAYAGGKTVWMKVLDLE